MTSATAPAALVCRGFGLAHQRDGVEEVLLQGVDLELPEHGFYLLVGTSGGGKSSLLRILAGLVEAREPPPRLTGELRLFGAEVGNAPPEAGQRVAAILQDEGLLDELSPRANVELALRAAGRSPRLAPALLAQAGLDHPPPRTAQLSGGMRKRLAVARALASQPRLLLCDEPTAGLDPAAATRIARLLREAHDADPERTTIVITHDLLAFAGIADGVLVLDRSARSLRLCPPDTQVPESGPGGREAPTEAAVEALVAHGLKRWLLRAAAVGETLLESLRRLPPFELGETVRTAARFTLDPSLFVALAGAVIGGLATFFALRNNPVEGAFEPQLLTGTGKVATAVLVPLLSGFFFSARIVAGAAARLGTMKRTNQIAALQMMGVRPADYLLTPLVWGMVVAMPLVTLCGVIGAAWASLLAAQLVTGITTAGWTAAYFATVDAHDVLVVWAKSSLAGYLVAVACYHLGTGPKRSGAEVGEAVNAAIVAAMALVLVVHAGLTFVIYG